MKTIFKCLPLLLIAVASCTKPPSLKEERYDQNFHGRRVGASAKDLLSDDKFTSLKVEIQYMTGFAPNEAAVGNLKDFLYAHLHKPGGISIETKEISPAKDSVLTLDMVWNLEKANRAVFTRDNMITIYILYTNGYYIENQMLGYAYRNTSAVLFGRNIHENSNRLKRPSRTYLETRVLQHEVGHLLGLVNVGSSLQSDHKDPEHGKHCLNKQCLMYYITDTEDFTSLLIKKELPTLDKACLMDLIANGGKDESEFSTKHLLSFLYDTF